MFSSWKILSLDQMDFDELLKSILLLSYRLIGFPRITDRDINRISRFNGSQTELKYYYVLRRDSKVTKAIFPLISLYIVTKAFYYLIYLTSSVDALEAGLNQIPSAERNHSSQSISIDCLRTNCLQRDLLIAIPIFTLCKPTLRTFFLPLVDLHTLGAIIYAIFALLLVVLGIGAILYNHILPIGHDSLMYYIAPNVGLDSVRAIIKDFLCEIYLSMMSFCSMEDQIQSDQKRESTKSTIAYSRSSMNSLVHRYGREDLSQKHFRTAHQRATELDREFKQLRPPAQSMVDDCLTLLRNMDVCRQITIKQFVTVCILFFMSSFTSCISLIACILLISRSRLVYLQSLDKSLAANKCSIWYSDDNSNEINLSEFTIRITYFDTIEVVLGGIICSVVGTAIMSSFYILTRETHNIMHEQIYRINMVIEMSYLMQFLSDHETNLKASAMKQFRSVSDFEVMGDSTNDYTFAQLNNTIAMDLCSIIDAKKIRSLLGLEKQRVLEVARKAATNLLITRGINMDSFFSLMSKIYCGNRYLLHCLRISSRNLSTVLLFAMLLNFSIIAIVKWITYKMNELSILQLVTAFGGVSVNTVIILYPSICQATSRRIVFLMWRLLASTLDFEDIRIKQIRYLYLKQLQVLCKEGGMTLYAYGVPVTYGGFIRLFFWSATLIVISYNRESKSFV